jgi:DNA polymerase (family 10)
MTNAEIAHVLEEIADLLDIEGADHFRILSYRRGAEVVANHGRELAAVVGEGGAKALDALPGIGESLAKKIVEMVETGKLAYHDELKAKYPPTLLDLLHVPGLGPKKVAELYHALQISSVEELAAAAQAGRLRDLPGMGVKTEENILHNLAVYQESGKRARLGEILPLAEKLRDELRGQPGVLAAEYAGSTRRGRETIGDLDILASSDHPAEVCQTFAKSDQLVEIIAAGDTKVSGRLPGGRQVDLRVVPPESWGAALVYFTGSMQHNVALRTRAQKMGLTINEYGVFQLEGEQAGPRVGGATEEEVYKAVGLPWITPELREDRGEIQAAEAGKLPKLIEEQDLRGDLHNHTLASDGHNSLEEMVEAALACRYEYLGISEHSGSLYVAHGLDGERVRAHRAAVDEINAALKQRGRKLHVLLGTEADIMPDGSVDLPEGTWELFDYVLASVHQGFSADADKITHRVLTALESGQVDVFCHPSGRILAGREAYGIHLEEVIKAAKKLDVALEINSAPERLDLDDVHARQVQEQGGLLCINTDAHFAGWLQNMRYGVIVARRGWVEAETVINTWPLGKLKKWLGKRRK